MFRSVLLIIYQNTAEKLDGGIGAWYYKKRYFSTLATRVLIGWRMSEKAELTDRQKFILTLLVHEYIHSANPVGSRLLMEKYHLDISSATIRNELSVLADLGYIDQPHTSAGRQPNEKGYRYFVSHLLQQIDLPVQVRHTISHQFFQMRHDVEQWGPLAASILANISRAASLVTTPMPEIPRLKHLELIVTQGKQVLMVLVLTGGSVHQRIISLDDPIPQNQLSIIAEKMVQLFRSQEARTITSIKADLVGLESDIAGWIVEEMNQADGFSSGEVYLDGLTNVMSEPEFVSSKEARHALHLLEERSLLYDILTSTLLTNQVGGVQVVIGGEGNMQELKQCSVILSRYGVPGLAMGTLGVLGPMRMPYDRTISTVRFMSNLLSSMVTDALVD